MFIKINNNTKVIVDYSNEVYIDLIDGYYQLNTSYNFQPTLEEAYWKHIKGHIFEFICYKDNRAFFDNQYNYSDFIQLITLKKVTRRLQYIATSTGYKLWFNDGNKEYFCSLNNDINGSDIISFETNYKNNANLLVDMTEEETGLLKFKPREVEATLYLPFVYFTTGIDTSLDQGPSTNFHIDTSVSGTTKISFEPDYSYYVDGGGFKIISGTPSTFLTGELRLTPLVPSLYGGNILLVSNKKLINGSSTFELNVPSKYIKYYSYMPIASVMEFTIKHSALDNIDIEVYLKIYK